MAEELMRLSESENSLEPLFGSIADGLDLCTQRAYGREVDSVLEGQVRSHEATKCEGSGRPSREACVVEL